MCIRDRLARALIHNPKILILDEPTAGVDVEIRQSMWKYLTQLNNEGMTIILTTHYLEEAESLCRNIAILNNGEIVEQSNMKKLLARAKRQVIIIDTIEKISGQIEISDCDCEVIDELAARAGVGEEVAEITAQAMRGELDFDESYRTRLALLEGLDARAVEELADRLPVKEGLREMTTTLKAQGLKLAIFSGGFMPIAERLQVDYGFDEVVANTLEIASGKVTGRVVPPIVNREHKAAALRALATRLGIGVDACIAVGDGANDLDMMAMAGLGVAFHAKPAVRAASPIEVTHCGLDGAVSYTHLTLPTILLV